MSAYSMRATMEILGESITLISALLISSSAFVLIRFGACVVYNLFFHPLANIPGPKVAAATSLWNRYHSLVKRQKYATVHALHATYGPILRVGPNTVVLEGPKYLKSVYMKKLDKPPEAAFFTTNRGTPNAFSAITTHEASGKRKGMLPHYATANLQRWHPAIFQHVIEATTYIKSVDGKHSIDILGLLGHTLVDILGEVILATKDIHAISDFANGRPNEIVKAISKFGRNAVQCKQALLHYPNSVEIYICRRIGLLGPRVWSVAKHFPQADWQDLVRSDAYLADCVGPKVYAAKALMDGGSVPEQPSLVQRLLSVINSSTQAPWDVEHVASECIDHFLAGTETTSVVLTYCFWQLARNPSVEQRLQQELDENVADSGDMLGLNVLANLPYLNAVLKETLRLHATSPTYHARLLSEEGLEAYGYFLPPKTAVGIQGWTCHRDPAVWGENACSFIPERWLAETPEMKNAFIPFSIGSRNCPGLNIAWTDMRILLSTICRQFSVTLADDTTEDSMRPMVLTTAVPASGECQLYYRARSNS